MEHLILQMLWTRSLIISHHWPCCRPCGCHHYMERHGRRGILLGDWHHMLSLYSSQPNTHREFSVDYLLKWTGWTVFSSLLEYRLNTSCAELQSGDCQTAVLVFLGEQGKPRARVAIEGDCRWYSVFCKLIFIENRSPFYASSCEINWSGSILTHPEF